MVGDRVRGVSNDDESNRDVIDQGFEVLDDAVDWFHDKVLRPIAVIGRTIAYGMVFLTLAVTVTVLVVILLVRIGDAYLFAAHPWITDLVIGAILWVIGLWVWRRRRPTLR